VRELAALHPNIAPAFVHVEPGAGLFEGHERLWELGGGPLPAPDNWLWLHEIWMRSAERGATVLLGGNRGNLFFSADGPEWLGQLLRAGRLGAALREAAAWYRSSDDGLFKALRGPLLLPLLPPRGQRLARALAGRRPDPLRDWIAHTGLRPEVAAELDLATRRPALDERRRTDWREVALHYTAAAAGAADHQSAVAALTGVETRDPTGDRRVLEVAMRQPEWVRRRGGMTRAVVREAMADRLPAAILNRTRRGEQLPNWLDVMSAARAELVLELDELVSHPLSRELIDVARLERLLERWPPAGAGADRIVARDYRLALFRSLFVSRYLRWFDRRRTRAGAAAGAAERGNLRAVVHVDTKAPIGGAE
jgi:asparagine synthase (glutamine-hydrolysing)